ncbi:MAG: STAS domain-containing protein [Candidatus Kapabacteria bacterium]|jgi:anti-sigma B factor antagonist|nr:STAS domain-containing protein [Candidatus Kapabacteria bacterium]
MPAFITSQPQPNTIVVHFGAQAIGGPDAVELASILREGVTAGVGTVVFDLAAVDVMNSSGLGMLVSSLTTLKKSDSAFFLAAVPEKVMALLTMTHLTTVFMIVPTVDDAVNAQ